MNEEKVQDKQSLKYMTLTYVGKDAVKKFKNEGQPDTISYKYKFKQNEEDQYTKNFWGYDTTKGAEILVELEAFTIGYIEGDNPKGDQPIKKARFFGEPREEDTKQEPSPEKVKEEIVTDSILEQTPTDDQLNDFMMVYKKAVSENKDKVDDVNQWIVAYIKSHMRDNKLIPCLEQRYAQEKVGKVKEEVVM